MLHALRRAALVTPAMLGAALRSRWYPVVHLALRVHMELGSHVPVLRHLKRAWRALRTCRRQERDQSSRRRPLLHHLDGLQNAAAVQLFVMGTPGKAGPVMA